MELIEVTHSLNNMILEKGTGITHIFVISDLWEKIVKNSVLVVRHKWLDEMPLPLILMRAFIMSCPAYGTLCLSTFYSKC